MKKITFSMVLLTFCLMVSNQASAQFSGEGILVDIFEKVLERNQNKTTTTRKSDPRVRSRKETADQTKTSSGPVSRKSSDKAEEQANSDNRVDQQTRTRSRHPQQNSEYKRENKKTPQTSRGRGVSNDNNKSPVPKSRGRGNDQ